MAAARYWRLVGIEALAGGDLELSEIAIFSGASRIDGAATLTSSHAPVAGSLADLKDGSTSTACRFAAADVRSAGFYLQWDFGSAIDPTEIKLGSVSSSALFLTAATLIQGASIGVWSYVATFSGVVYPGAGALTSSSSGGVVPTTWNPADKSVNCSLSNGNLTAASGGGDNGPVRSVFGASAGKWYWELQYSGALPILGIALPSWVLTDYPGYGANSIGFYGAGTPKKIKDAVQTNYGAAWSSGVVLGVMLDMDAKTITLAVGGTSQGVMFSGLSGTYHAASASSSSSNAIVTANFGGSAFVYAPPAGYTAGFGATVMALPLMASALVHTLRSGQVTAGSSAVGSHRMPSSLEVSMARDVEHGGPGTIYGTTKTKGVPNTPTKARVVLHHQRSKLPVRETWSDPVTGAFAFTGIDTSQQFLTLAEDAAGNFRPVAANKLTPEVLS